MSDSYWSQEKRQALMRQAADGLICGADTNMGRGICTKAPLEDNDGRCEIHGKKRTQVATRKPRGYSAVMPEHLISIMKTSNKNVDLKSLNSEIELVQFRIAELASKMNDRMTPDGLNQLGRLFKEWRIADGEKKQAALYRFEIEFEALLQEASAWQEIRETVDLKRKLIESENKKLKSMSMYVTVEQVKLLLSSIINLIDNSLTDITGMLVDEPLKLKVMKRVATGIARLTSTSPEEITKEQNEEESQNEQY